MMRAHVVGALSLSQETMVLNQHIDIPLDQIEALAQKYPIRRLSLFGSVLRDDFRPDSDIDVLVEFEPDSHMTYLDLATIQFELEDIFHRDVHVLTPRAISEYFVNDVMKTAQMIYERK